MLIATFQFDHGAVALGQAFGDVPEMEVDVERIAAHSTRWTMPCLWVAADDFAAVDQALRTDPSVEQIVESTEFDDEKYYHLEWADSIEERVNNYIDKRGSILSAEATAHHWKLQIRFASRDQFKGFRERLSKQNHSFELLDLTEPGTPRTSTGGLTPNQRDALIAAREHGYYKIPHEISTRELADELGISHQSLSEVLRRGTEKVIDSALTTERPNVEE